MNRPGTAMAVWFFVLGLCALSLVQEGRAESLPDLVAKVGSLGAAERESLLIKGAKKEGQMVYYGTLPVNQFAVLKQAFSSRYPFLAPQQYYSPRQGILNRALSEARAGSQVADVLMLDISYGSELMKAGIVHPYILPERKRFFDGSYDKQGFWYTMYHLTVALAYNPRQVRAEFVPREYSQLLQPRWKRELLFDPEAGYVLAAMESAWGKEKAVSYLRQLATQEVSFRRGGTLTTQLVAAGEYPIAIAINGETAAEVRESGAPLGFSVLRPRIIKPNGLFLAKKAPNPHAALLFTDWVLSEEGQKFLATTLGKGVAMRGIQVKHKEFQVEPDFVVSPELGMKLREYIKDFQKIFGIS